MGSFKTPSSKSLKSQGCCTTRLTLKALGPIKPKPMAHKIRGLKHGDPLRWAISYQTWSTSTNLNKENPIQVMDCKFWLPDLCTYPWQFSNSNSSWLTTICKLSSRTTSNSELRRKRYGVKEKAWKKNHKRAKIDLVCNKRLITYNENLVRHQSSNNYIEYEVTAAWCHGKWPEDLESILYTWPVASDHSMEKLVFSVPTLYFLSVFSISKLKSCQVLNYKHPSINQEMV